MVVGLSCLWRILDYKWKADAMIVYLVNGQTVVRLNLWLMAEWVISGEWMGSVLMAK